MTDQPPSTPRGRHRSSGSTSRTWLIVGLVVAMVAAAGVVTWLVRSNSSTATASANNTADRAAAAGSAGTSTGELETSGAPTSGAGSECELDGGSLTVAAAPDLAATLTDIVSEQKITVGGCSVRIESTDPAQVAADGKVAATVWIPDSSIWLARANTAGLTGTAEASVATSPVVFALSGAALQQLSAAGGSADVAGILATRKLADPIRVGMPDPEKSAAAVAAVLAAKAAVTGTQDARAALTWGVRSSPADLPVADDELLARLSTDPATAVPVTEQALVAFNRANPGNPAHAVYPGRGGFAMDYPVVTVGTDPAVARAAGDLTTALQSAEVRQALQAAGFRAPDRTAGSALTATNGVDPGHTDSGAVPSGQDVTDAIRDVQTTNEASRMLAVMDISGSMLAQVPGANGATRIDLAKAAAGLGLGLYRADSDIGLWEFSTNLDGMTDHRELIGISTLGADGQGGTGAARLAAALSGLQAIPNGGTGLYDTVLDAVRTVRAGWDPNRVNSVLVLPDGMNDDDNSITMDQLLSTLAAEQDPAKPIPVIAIAFGPDSDVNALQQISKATGGATYLSQDPRQIGEIFLDAVGQRLCRPSC
jgi:hypothetical protein